ncbi:MAG: formimidoylglutamate deiminase [Burkholderiales bacterium]|nr:formimidoylglutamate deiminase [Burkholderiales bacterium]
MTRLWCARAWVDNKWASRVLLEANSHGYWQRITPNTEAPQDDTSQFDCVIPGLVNAHSHAFQRTMASLTERQDPNRPGDDFWGWRERMYQVALRIGPTELEIVAEWLYREMLQSGFTQVCEFHYLHLDPEGRPYSDSLELGLALTRAAERAGIGLTLLPTLYMHRGFGQTGLSEAQRRFACTPDEVLEWQSRIQAQAQFSGRTHLLNAGVALHSLRAVDAGAIRAVAQCVGEVPLHIHVAEQTSEVADCVEHLGQRPVEWLLEHIGLDNRWNLVHATHSLRHELAGIASSGATVVLCPTTEANLGDGLFDLTTSLTHEVKWSVGTDSHINRHPALELQLLEYGQRLHLRQRNLAARHAKAHSTAAVLFEGALKGGLASCGQPLGGFLVGQRADAVALDAASAPLFGVPLDHYLDAWVMGQPSMPVSSVWVAGKKLDPKPSKMLQTAWLEVMKKLWS